MKAVSTACLARHLMFGIPVSEPLWVPPPSFPPGKAAAWLLPADAAAVPVLRDACRALLQAWEVEDTAESICLVLNELVTNAIKHGRAPIHVMIANFRNALDIEVFDYGDELPLPETSTTRFAEETEGGRGLSLIVGALARLWTVTRIIPSGKIVAALVPLQHPDHGGAADGHGAVTDCKGLRFTPRSVEELVPLGGVPISAPGATGARCGISCGAAASCAVSSVDGGRRPGGTPVRAHRDPSHRRQAGTVQHPLGDALSSEPGA